MVEDSRERGLPPATRPQSRSVWTPRQILWTVILVLLLIFIVQNVDDARVNLLFWDVTLPLALILLIFGVAGYILGWLRPHFRARRRL